MDLETNAYRDLQSTCLTLFGWNERFAAERLLSLFESYFSSSGVVPHYANFQIGETEELKRLSFKNLKKRLLDGKLKDLSSLSLYHFTEKENKSSEDFYSSYDVRYGNEIVQFLTAIGEEARRSRLLLMFLHDMLDLVTPEYGYSLDLPLGDNPSLFAVGAFSYRDDIQDEVHVWQQSSNSLFNGSAYKQGRMRHVFAINVLSRPHMEARIDGRTFGEWVAGPNRGSIEQWKDGVWVWQVQKELRIRIATILHFNGILTAPDGFQNRLIG
jgi:hypothetical protein